MFHFAIMAVLMVEYSAASQHNARKMSCDAAKLCIYCIESLIFFKQSLSLVVTGVQLVIGCRSEGQKVPTVRPFLCLQV